MKTVAIVGVGLIGGSFGLAIRKAGFDGEIIGVSSQPAIEAGLRSGAISSNATLEQATARADLIYLAQPVDRILDTIEQLGCLAPARCLITDAGSTKTAIVQKAADCLPSDTFLGGHPMAGKEQRGVEAADAELFRNRPYVLTPTGPETPASRDLRSWLELIGANITDMSAQDHDATVAFTSHMPQLLSTALAVTLSRQSNPHIRRVFGSGLLDMTRLALSSPDLWVSILKTNELQVNDSLESLIGVLVEMKDAIQSDNLANLMENGSVFASRLRVTPLGRPK
ncbi:MAG TPA: prephenate dehydrogenase/arogenate dehydrogenase family protein [Bryobacteraceae bacterium]|nr:prephenate dehydrogenase/arogenate dehydrogenase family protein [Bryobacteraceae bacterium]